MLVAGIFTKLTSTNINDLASAPTHTTKPGPSCLEHRTSECSTDINKLNASIVCFRLTSIKQSNYGTLIGYVPHETRMLLMEDHVSFMNFLICLAHVTISYQWIQMQLVYAWRNVSWMQKRPWTQICQSCLTLS